MSKRGRGRPPGTSHDEILKIAISLFLEQGYANTSLASIAEAAGVSRTTLFAYFPSKRDLIWEDHHRRVLESDRGLDELPTFPLVDLILEAILISSRYGLEERTVLAARLRISEQDGELRAFAALAHRELIDRISRQVAARAPAVDPDLILRVTGALVGASARCSEEWAFADAPGVTLDEFTRERIRPIVGALRPVLP